MAFESPRLARGASLSREELETLLHPFLHSIRRTSTIFTGAQTMEGLQDHMSRRIDMSGSVSQPKLHGAIGVGASQDNAGRIMPNPNTEDVDPREQTRSLDKCWRRTGFER